MYYILSEVLGVVAELFTYHLFVQGTFYKRDRHWIAPVVTYGILGGVLLALSFLENGSVIRMIYCIVAFTIIAKQLFDSSFFQSLFMSLSFMCLYALTDVFTITIGSLMDIDVDVIMSRGGIRTVFIAFTHTVLFVITLVVLAITKKKRNAVTLPFLMAILPGCISGLMMGIYFCQSVQNTGEDVSPAILIIAAGLLYLNILIVFYAERTQEANERRHKAELAEQHYAMQEQYYAQLREDQNETRAMFHDINKYLRAMRALASEANTKEASQVFAEAQDLVQSLVSVVDVGNTVISVILNDYKAQAEEQNIRFDYDVSVPANLGITAVDAYVIMGNTLDNAIEACCSLPEEQRYIHVQLRAFHDILYYQIENPYTPEYLKKAKKKGHGYGLQNVRRCVEKHKGDLAITDEGGKYVLALRINHKAGASK